MYDVRQFKPVLYAVLMTGAIGFSMAADAPGLLGLFAVATGLNAWLVHTGRFVPLPRWLANLTTLLALAYAVDQVWRLGGPPLAYIGQFLAMLQMVKLYEQRANRDYAQLLVLSLLLMVAAAINTASLLFAVLLLAYLVLSLYCCLLFHLKCEADRARQSFAIPPEQVSPSTLRQDQRYLAQSMRRLTALVLVVALSTAVLTFLFFPRGAGAGLLGELPIRPPSPQTGFSDSVSFESIARIQQNDEIVAQVSVWHDGAPQGGSQPLILRGATFDEYGGSGGRGRSWSRARNRDGAGALPEVILPENNEHLLLRRPGREGERWKHRVVLKSAAGTNVFAPPGPTRIRTSRQISLSYAPADECIRSAERLYPPFEYEITSTGELGSPDAMRRLEAALMVGRGGSDRDVLQRLGQFTDRPEVLGDLAGKRSRVSPYDPADAEIARRIEAYLKRNYTYTLDLTDERDLLGDEDPIVAFLTTVRKGHCEYFASAMTLMCQSLGIKARLVAGFLCDEFNDWGYYVVRHSHAHAWVEVLAAEESGRLRWLRFDPTSGREAPRRRGGWLRSVRDFLNYLDYKWAVNVVAYDQARRDNLMLNLDRRLTNTAIRGSDILGRLRQWIGSASFWQTSFNVLNAVIWLMVMVIVGAIAWFVVDRIRLSRRAARIGLGALPGRRRIRLARQLAFYDALAGLLSRHRMMRRPHQTHREFAQGLTHLPSEAYDAVVRLTDLLYRVRFGRVSLTPARQRRLEAVVARLGETLDAWSAVR